MSGRGLVDVMPHKPVSRSSELCLSKSSSNNQDGEEEFEQKMLDFIEGSLEQEITQKKSTLKKKRLAHQLSLIIEESKPPINQRNNLPSPSQSVSESEESAGLQISKNSKFDYKRLASS